MAADPLDELAFGQPDASLLADLDERRAAGQAAVGGQAVAARSSTAAWPSVRANCPATRRTVAGTSALSLSIAATSASSADPYSLQLLDGLLE